MFTRLLVCAAKSSVWSGNTSTVSGDQVPGRLGVGCRGCVQCEGWRPCGRGSSELAIGEAMVVSLATCAPLCHGSPTKPVCYHHNLPVV